MTPDYDRAATKAAETLLKYKVYTSPVDPVRIMKAKPGVLVVSFAELSERIRVDRMDMLHTFSDSQDAATSVLVDNGKKYYLVVYNQKLSRNMVRMALARELGHIVLGHDGSLSYEVRHAEAKCFAHHLLAPRALIHAIQVAGVRFTMEVFNNLTECNDRCLGCMRFIPETHVPAELNRQVRDNFMDYIQNFFEVQRMFTPDDGTAVCDLGTYMNGYEE